MRRPRIVFVCYSLQPGLGGIPQVARSISAALGDARKQNRITFNTLCFMNAEACAGAPSGLYSAGASHLRMALKAMRLGLTCDAMLYDSVNMAQLNRLPFLQHKPCHAFLHGVEIWENAKPRWVNAARRARHLLVNSAYTRERAIRCHGPAFERAAICHLGTHSDTPPALKPHFRSNRVLIVSRIDKNEMYKGHAELIQCWPEVLRNVPQAELHIAGKGSGESELRQQTPASLLNRHIFFHGYVPEPELRELYSESSVFAMPSRGEGFGLVYIDAMRSGLPVITSKQDAGQEVIEDGVTGYAVDMNHPEELPQRLIALLSDRNLARAMGQAGQRRWQEQFTASAFKNRFLANFSPLLQPPTSGQQI